MKILLLLGLLVILHNQVSCKPMEKKEDDYINDEYSDDYDDDSTNNEDEDEVEELPTFITKPMHLTVKEHSDVTLPCEISGNTGSYTIMWKKKNEIIFQDTHIFQAYDPKKFLLVNSTSLSIKNVNANDAGDYSCMVLISAEETESVKHTLTVQQPATIVSLTSDKDTYKSGDNLELTCTVTGDPEATIIWSLRGDRLGTGPKLIIENIKNDKAGGDYQCMADNGIKPVSHRSIHINVMHKPVVTLEKTTTNFNGDSYDVELRCKVRSNPKSIIVWRKDGEALNRAHREKNSVYILKLEKVDSTQFGKYSCSAVNQIGDDEQHVMITNAPGKATFQGVTEHGKEFNLTWSVESLYPIIEYVLEYKKTSSDEWMIEKPEVTNSDSGNLYTINYVLKNLDGAEYEVRVRSRNEYGWSEYTKPRTFEAHNAHHGHKHQKNHHQNKPISGNEEDNNIALETRVEGTETSSSVTLLPTTSLLCLAALTFFNRH